MRKQTKGILAFAFLGGIMATSGVVIAIPGIAPDGSQMTMTGTPADNFPDDERPRFCGSGFAMSTKYIQEFQIPTECTNPLAIVADYDGNVWFAQTNTGMLAKFDPSNQTFTEYENPSWPNNARSMIWGIDYAPDGSVWFTDEAHRSVWRFSTADEQYNLLPYPAGPASLPQRLEVDGSQIIINDFLGNKLDFMDPTASDEDSMYVSVPSPVDNSVTGDFAIDRNGNIWYTNWIFQQNGVLVKFDQPLYLDRVAATGQEFLPLFDYLDIYEMPFGLMSPNGIEVDGAGRIWLADTSSSSFFMFDPATEDFVQYVTAEPDPSSYGNQTGVVKTPISRPYWMDIDEQGRIVFNAQTANTISVMDPGTDSLVEYLIPSKNPHWADCDPGDGAVADCGVAQVFDFAIDGHRIWFTEWVENNIGVVDTGIPLPARITLESDSVSLGRDESADIAFTVTSASQDEVGLRMQAGSTHDFILASLADRDVRLGPGESHQTQVRISVSESVIPGTYKVLVGMQAEDVAVSQFVTVEIA